MKCFSILVAVVAVSCVAPAWASGPIPVVAAENFYGDVARQIGGTDVMVTSILNNPAADPHLFEASPSVARAISAARIVIYNGAGYDPWATNLLDAARRADRKRIDVAALVGKKAGDNPHIWYDPHTMLKLAATLAEELSAADPAHRPDYARRLVRFEQSIEPIQTKIAAQRERLAGTPVTATEPIASYMFDALGMPVRNTSFQRAVMNSTEPSASDIAAFEDDLKNRKVKLLVYNSQASDPLAERMMKLAEASGIPVVGASETEPPGKTYQQWMISVLDAIDHAIPQ